MTYMSDRGRIIPPQLDDRTWQDLVDEMRALIPTYAPQWTDNNPSDPGITIIEMFAMLVEGLIYRLNRVPDKHYIAFLHLLGITRNPPTPAITHLTFETSTGTVVVPAGTQSQTVATELESAIVFETDTDAKILPINLRRAVLITPYSGVDPAQLEYEDVSAALVGPPASSYTLTVPQNQTAQLCLGFDKPTAEAFSCRLLLRRPPSAKLVELSVVYSKDEGVGAEATPLNPHKWSAASNVVDSTDSLRRDGDVSLTCPADWAAHRPTGNNDGKGWAKAKPRPGTDPVTDPLHWVGLRIKNSANRPATTTIDRLLFNSARARNALTIRSAEILGTSTNGPFQEFSLANSPLDSFIQPRGGLTIEVARPVGANRPPAWETWEVRDELPAGNDRVCRLNPVSGTVMFGNYDDKRKDGHGAIPPAGAEIRARTYRYVAGGTSGNVAANTVTIIGSTRQGGLPSGVSKVTNYGPASEGSDEEPIEETLRRAPEVLKTHDRAVTPEDYQNLALAATTDIVKAKCLPPKMKADNSGAWNYSELIRAPGSVFVLIVPDNGPEDPRPEPSTNQIAEVQSYLDQRRDLTANLKVAGPVYLPVKVTATFNVWKQTLNAGVTQQDIIDDAVARINAYLHPTRGAADGTGWNAGQPVFASDVLRAIMLPDDVGYVSSLLISTTTTAERPPGVNPSPAGSMRVFDYETVCAANAHEIHIDEVN